MKTFVLLNNDKDQRVWFETSDITIYNIREVGQGIFYKNKPYKVVALLPAN